MCSFLVLHFYPNFCKALNPVQHLNNFTDMVETFNAPPTLVLCFVVVVDRVIVVCSTDYVPTFVFLSDVFVHSCVCLFARVFVVAVFGVGWFLISALAVMSRLSCCHHINFLYCSQTKQLTQMKCTIILVIQKVHE